MTLYNMSSEQVNCFDENSKYIMNQIENNLKNIDILENDFYFEMSKNQIVDCFKKVLTTLDSWKKYFNDDNIYHIQKEYKELESDISELELCLVDYDDIFHCEGISYALYQIGNLLIEISNVKDSNQNV